MYHKSSEHIYVRKVVTPNYTLLPFLREISLTQSQQPQQKLQLTSAMPPWLLLTASTNNHLDVSSNLTDNTDRIEDICLFFPWLLNSLWESNGWEWRSWHVQCSSWIYAWCLTKNNTLPVLYCRAMHHTSMYCPLRWCHALQYTVNTFAVLLQLAWWGISVGQCALLLLVTIYYKSGVFTIS